MASRVQAQSTFVLCSKDGANVQLTYSHQRLTCGSCQSSHEHEGQGSPTDKAHCLALFGRSGGTNGPFPPDLTKESANFDECLCDLPPTAFVLDTGVRGEVKLPCTEPGPNHHSRSR